MNTRVTKLRKRFSKGDLVVVRESVEFSLVDGGGDVKEGDLGIVVDVLYPASDWRVEACTHPDGNDMCDVHYDWAVDRGEGDYWLRTPAVLTLVRNRTYCFYGTELSLVKQFCEEVPAGELRS